MVAGDSLAIFMTLHIHQYWSPSEFKIHHIAKYNLYVVKKLKRAFMFNNFCVYAEEIITVYRLIVIHLKLRTLTSLNFKNHKTLGYWLQLDLKSVSKSQEGLGVGVVWFYRYLSPSLILWVLYYYCVVMYNEQVLWWMARLDSTIYGIKPSVKTCVWDSI